MTTRTLRKRTGFPSEPAASYLLEQISFQSNRTRCRAVVQTLEAELSPAQSSPTIPDTTAHQHRFPSPAQELPLFIFVLTSHLSSFDCVLSRQERTRHTPGQTSAKSPLQSSLDALLLEESYRQPRNVGRNNPLTIDSLVFLAL